MLTLTAGRLEKKNGMEFQMTNNILWIGIISFYLATALMLFRSCITTYTITDSEKRAAHIEHLIQVFLVWIAGLMLILTIWKFY
jgi:hypothetical protein